MELLYQCHVKFVAKISRIKIVAILIYENSMIFIQNQTGEEKQVTQTSLGTRFNIFIML